MATEQSTTVSTESGPLAMWGSWLAALVGLWIAASPVLRTGEVTTGAPMYSAVVGGLVILALGAFGAYTIRSRADRDAFTPAEIAGWVAALVGLWILASPFVLSGEIGSGTPMYSNVAAGVVSALLAAYVGYDRYGG